MKKIVSGTMLTLLLIGMLTVAFDIQPVKASGTIYVRADGSVDQPTAPIQRNGDIYTLTGNITSDADGIIIEADNITLDGTGFSIQGTGSGAGIRLSGRSNVTVKNTTVISFFDGIDLISASRVTLIGNNITANIWYSIYLGSFSYDNGICGNSIANSRHGIYLLDSYNTIISGNALTNNEWGIRLGYSSNNGIIGNNITANNDDGIWFDRSSNNSICENNIMNNSDGILLVVSSNNSISGNNIMNNQNGIWFYISSNNNSVSGNNITANNQNGIILEQSSDNSVYHNNLKENVQQVDVESPSYPNGWDNGYPSGGNYWSDYTGVDCYKGPYQNETGSDGIGDTPYIIDENNTDPYPLMKPYPWTQHDIGVTYIGKVWEIYFPPIILSLKTIVGLGFRLHINVFVMNYGAYTEVFNVTIYANTTAIDTISNFTLSSRSSAILNFTWDTTGFAKGNYTLWAYATPVENETDITDNTMVAGTVYVGIVGDVIDDGKVDMKDIGYACMHYGEKDP
jgi:parallel beta-helix repeat protein